MKYLQSLMLHCIKTYGTLTVVLLYAPSLVALVMYGQFKL